MISSVTEKPIGLEREDTSRPEQPLFVSFSFPTLLIVQRFPVFGRKDKEPATPRFKVSVGSQLYAFTASGKTPK